MIGQFIEGIQSELKPNDEVKFELTFPDDNQLDQLHNDSREVYQSLTTSEKLKSMELENENMIEFKSFG